MQWAEPLPNWHEWELAASSRERGRQGHAIRKETAGNFRRRNLILDEQSNSQSSSPRKTARNRRVESAGFDELEIAENWFRKRTVGAVALEDRDRDAP